MAPGRPQRQARSSVSYKDAPSDEDEVAREPPQAMEQARPKRSLSLKRSSRAQERANAKDRAEAKQLERAISESLNSSFVHTYSRGGEKGTRVTFRECDLEAREASQILQRLHQKPEAVAFQAPVDAFPVENSSAEACGQAAKEVLAPQVCEEKEDQPQVPVAAEERPVRQASPDLEIGDEGGHPQDQLNSVDGDQRRESCKDEEDEYAAASSEDDQATRKVAADVKGPGRKTNARRQDDDDAWSADEESESEEDEDDVFAQDSDDSDIGKGGAKKKRTAHPASNRSDVIKRARSNRAAPKKPTCTKEASPKMPKMPTSDTRARPAAKVIKPSSAAQENVNATAKVSCVKAGNPKGTTTSGLQPARLPLKPLNHISTPSKTSALAAASGTGPPLQFPNAPHRRVLGLSKRYQPPPLHPYLQGT